MAGFGWIHTRFRSFDLELWHRFQQRNLTSTKTEKQKNNTIKTHHITKKHSIWRFTRKKTQKRQNKSIKTWCLRSFVYFVVCVWCSCFVFGFSFCILGFKLLVFLFAMLLHFSWFNYFFKKKRVFQNHLSLQRASKKIPGSKKILGSKEKQIQNVWKEGGTASPLLQIHFWARYD